MKSIILSTYFSPRNLKILTVQNSSTAQSLFKKTSRYKTQRLPFPLLEPQFSSFNESDIRTVNPRKVPPLHSLLFVSLKLRNFLMDCSSRTAAVLVTPRKDKSSRSNPTKFEEAKRCSENCNPNVSSPDVKSSHLPSMIKLGKSPKQSASRNPNRGASPFSDKRIRERKFLIAKKSRKGELSCSTATVFCEKCKTAIWKSKCLCVAYQSLRASQEGFFKDGIQIEADANFERLKKREGGNDEEDMNLNPIDPITGIFDEGEGKGNDFLTEKNWADNELGMKRSRERLLDETREDGPEPGSGRVMHLVKAFENLHFLPKVDDSGERESEELQYEKDKECAVPGLQQPTDNYKPQVSCSTNFCLTLENLGLDSTRSYSLGSSGSKGSISTSTRTYGGCGRSRRRSNESSGALARRHHEIRQLKVTSQKPFMLKTEQRGKCKAEEFMKKLQQMNEEEQRLRIPIAQGLPWTTDEPECLVKPPVKESTKPVDVVLHSDVRAEERAEFDHQVAQKMSFIEQLRAERGRQQKLEEEEEIRRLRKEIIPKAQPMPYFDRPFVPKRSTKQPTIPREPKFHTLPHKKIKCCLPCEDNCSEYNG